MMSQFSSFTIWINITNEMPQHPFPFIQLGRIMKDQIQQCVPDIVTRSFYVLGPTAFMKTMKEIVHVLVQENYQHFMQTARTGPDNEKPEDALKCWQAAY